MWFAAACSRAGASDRGVSTSIPRVVSDLVSDRCTYRPLLNVHSANWMSALAGTVS